MAPSSRAEQVYAAVAAFEAAAAALGRLDSEVLTDRQRVAILARIQGAHRSAAMFGHRTVAALSGANPVQLGARTMPEVLARSLQISRRAARRRIEEAAVVAPRRMITGELLPPVLPATSAGVAAGAIGAEQVDIIRRFFARLPEHVDGPTREAADRTLADLAAHFIPEQLAVCAQRLAILLNPDGRYTEADRARRRGVHIGAQGADGMSAISGWLDPQLRASLDALLAKLAAPGMCNPEREKPRIDGMPTDEEIAADTRTAAQRTHDALTAACRAVLASGKLGKHRGLPATIVITTSLQELESASGWASTGGGTLLPMSDVIRLARHAHHYLSVFDKHTRVPLYLGRSKRTASPGQRLVLYARERGCTHPGCTVGGYLCEVHHVAEWVKDRGQTNIDILTLACPGDHRMIGEHGWKTTKDSVGQTVWHPPPHLQSGGSGVNTYHHPEQLLGSFTTGTPAETDTSANHEDFRGDPRGEDP